MGYLLSLSHKIWFPRQFSGWKKGVCTAYAGAGNSDGRLKPVLEGYVCTQRRMVQHLPFVDFMSTVLRMVFVALCLAWGLLGRDSTLRLPSLLEQGRNKFCSDTWTVCVLGTMWFSESRKLEARQEAHMCGRQNLCSCCALILCEGWIFMWSVTGTILDILGFRHILTSYPCSDQLL